LIEVPVFEDAQVAVLGLGRSGLSAARALKAGGAKPLLWDDGEAAREEASEAGFEIASPERLDWDRIAALVAAPGVPLTHPEPNPVVAAAQAAGVEVIGDVELFVRAIAEDRKSGTRIIAITGTNGKSTTTALTGHLLSDMGREVAIGGNIGVPVLELPRLSAHGLYVLEVSSFQLDLTPGLKADIAALINIAPDHLDRHGDMAGYIAAKRRVFAGQSDGQIAILGIDDPYTEELSGEIGARSGPFLIPVSVGKALGRGVFVLNGILHDATGLTGRRVADLTTAPALRGEHNWQNAAMAYACVSPFVGEPGRLEDAFRSFPGLPHRMEDVGRLGRVQFVNDSKATNPDAASKALASYERIYWIAGGRAKDGGLGAMEPFFPRIAKAYLIGESADVFAAALTGRVDCVHARTIERAVAEAARDALADKTSDVPPVVLLSPACASFDQYSNFEKRGDAFREAVSRVLNGSRAGGGEAA
jgi:UDP-N-acetylmuramoylalanine--D-glutamate ligase